jgi:hypothetical protein
VINQIGPVGGHDRIGGIGIAGENLARLQAAFLPQQKAHRALRIHIHSSVRRLARPCHAPD